MGLARKIVVDTQRLDQLLVELCVESFASEPSEVVLDLDAIDIPLHGAQEERFFHGYYREYCYMPVLFLIGQQPVLVWMRSAARDAAAGVAEDLGWLLDRLREAWPSTRIIQRTDSGFCRESILAACESREGVDYVMAVVENRRLEPEIGIEMAEAVLEAKEKAARRFREFSSATRTSWSRERRVIGKAEAPPPAVEGGNSKENPRFIVTSLPADSYPARFVVPSSAGSKRQLPRRVGSRNRDQPGFAADASPSPGRIRSRNAKVNSWHFSGARSGSRWPTSGMKS